MNGLNEEIRLCLGQNDPVVAVVRHLIESEADAGVAVREILDGSSPGLQKRLVATILNRGQGHLLAEMILAKWPPSPGAWKAISLLSSDTLTALQRQRRDDWSARICQQPPGILQQANANLVCRHIPQLKADLIRNLNPLTLRVICLHCTDEDFFALVDRLLESDEPLPTVLGLCLTPMRLLQLLAQRPETADQLAARHGYTDRVPLFVARAFLDEQITHVNSAMAERDPAAVRRDVNLVQRWLNHAAGYLELNNARNEFGDNQPAFGFSSAYGQGILFAAARELEYANLIIRRQANPFEFTAVRDQATDASRLLHVPSSLLHQILIADAAKTARQCDVPAEHEGRFFVEHAALQLQPDADLRTEDELFLRGRWCAMSAAQDWDYGRRKPELFESTRRLPAALPLVVPTSALDACIHPDRPRLQRSQLDQQISPCATAVCRLGEVYLSEPKAAELCERIRAAESSSARMLSPIGVEVQVPRVDDNLHVAWKELLRSVGIPSQRRPECGRMLEASLPPAASAEPIMAFLELLLRLGVVTGSQDLGIHVSLQGEIGDRARYLAFPQLFLNRTVNTSPKPRDAMRMVMSKGFVHTARDARRCTWSEPSEFRTEIRVFTAAVQGDDDLLVDSELVSAVRQTHLLASAMLSNDAGLSDLSDQYIRSLTSYVTDLPAEFTELLAADFFESTGDYSDPSLLGHLSILHRRDAVRAVSDDMDMEQVRSCLSEIRGKYAVMAAEIAGC